MKKNKPYVTQTETQLREKVQKLQEELALLKGNKDLLLLLIGILVFGIFMHLLTILDVFNDLKG